MGPAIVVAAVGDRRWREGLWVAGAGLLGSAVALGLCFWIGGSHFLVQAIAFHLTKSSDLGAGTYLRLLWHYLPILLPLGALAAIAGARRMPAATVWVVCEALYLSFAAKVVWEHDVFPLIAACALAVAASWGGLSDRVPKRRAQLAIVATMSITLAAVVLGRGQVLAPLLDPGWSGVRINDVDQMAAALDAATPAGATVIAPTEVSVRAGRPSLIPYPEVEGLGLQLEAAQRDGRLWTVVKHDRELPFVGLLATTRDEWRPMVNGALGTDPLRAVVTDASAADSPLSALSEVTLSDDALARNGYEPRDAIGDYHLYVLAHAQMARAP
jgi:hypothetical protein